MTGQHAEFVGENSLAVIESFENGSVGSGCLGRSVGQQAGGIVEDLRGEQCAE